MSMITFQALVTDILEGLKVKILVTNVTHKTYEFYRDDQPMRDNQRVTTGIIIGLTHDDHGYDGIAYNLIVKVDGELKTLGNMNPDTLMKIST